MILNLVKYRLSKRSWFLSYPRLDDLSQMMEKSVQKDCWEFKRMERDYNKNTFPSLALDLSEIFSYTCSAMKRIAPQ